MNTYYGVPGSEVHLLLASEQSMILEEVNRFKKKIKMDGHYVSKDKLEEIITEAETIGQIFYDKEKIDEVRPKFNELLSNLYEVRHDSSGLRNKYS